MPVLLRRSSGWISAAALAVMALALAGSVQVPASTGVLPSGSLIPPDSQRSPARKVARILEDQHYSRAAIDDKMSDVVYQRYLEFLDGQRSYFLASDISDFNIYRYRFGDMIRTGNIDPAYLIFARFQQRNSERMEQLWRKRVKNDALSRMLTGKSWPEASDILRKRYERVLRRVDQVTSEDVFENLMNAYARAFDPHSSYFSRGTPEEY